MNTTKSTNEKRLADRVEKKKLSERKVSALKKAVAVGLDPESTDTLRRMLCEEEKALESITRTLDVTIFVSMMNAMKVCPACLQPFIEFWYEPGQWSGHFYHVDGEEGCLFDIIKTHDKQGWENSWGLGQYIPRCECRAIIKDGVCLKGHKHE